MAKKNGSASIGGISPAVHTDEIISKVRALLEKNKSPEFRAGFRRGVVYLDTHTRSFFKEKTDKHMRDRALGFLEGVYTKEERLFNQLNAESEYSKGYLYAVYSLVYFFKEYENFDSAFLFNGLYDMFRQMKIKRWGTEDGKEKKLSEKEKSANGTIIGAVKKELHDKPTGFKAGYLRSADYLEIHARFFFEANTEPSARNGCLVLLNESIKTERTLFAGGLLDDVRKSGYFAGLAHLATLLEDNINFEPASLFKELDDAIRNMLKHEVLEDTLQ